MTAVVYFWMTTTVATLVAAVAVVGVLLHRLRVTQSSLRRLQRTLTEKPEEQVQPEASASEPVRRSLSPRDEAFRKRLTETIMEEMAQGRVEVETLADRMCISRSQLNRRVKAITGLSTSNYSLAVRLDEAARLLRENPEVSVGDVARQCGFNDAAYFTRAFKQRLGCSPTSYRIG